MAKQDPQQQSAPKQRQPYQEQEPMKRADPELSKAVQAIADSPVAQPFTPGTPLEVGDKVRMLDGTVQAVASKSNGQVEAERNITRRLMEACLQEVRTLPRTWDQLSEDAQDEVIHRIRKAANEVTAEVIATVAAGASRERVIVEIVTVAVKAKVADVKLQLKSTDPAVHAIVGARGEQAVLVIGADPADYGVNKDGIVPDADQRPLLPD